MKILGLLVFSIALLSFSSKVTAQDTTFNLSVNPEENGSSILGNFKVSWNPHLQSILNISYNESNNTSSTIPGFGTSIQSLDISRMQLDVLPMSFRVPIGKISLGLSVGGSFIYINENISALMEDANGILLDPAGQYVSYSSKRNSTIFSPRVGVSIEGLHISILRFLYTGYISPIYFLTLDQEMDYDFLPVPSSNSITRWSSPYLEQSLTMDVFNFCRVAFEHSYQRLDFQTMDWDSAGTKLVGVDDIQNINELRLGLLLLLPIRAGTVRFKGGVFWINDFTSSSYWGITDQDMKVLFRFGIEG